MTTIVGIPVLFGLSIEVYAVLLCIAVPAFFFWRWFFRKNIKDKDKRNIATWFSTIVLTPIIYTTTIGFFIFLISREPRKSFDKSTWLANKEIRFEMGDDIIKSKMLIDKDTIQVKQLLGDPSWRNSALQQWVYEMGTGGGGLGFLLHSLYVHLDKGKVISVEHIRVKD